MFEGMVHDAMLEDPDLTFEEAIDHATTVKNERHIERGYHPSEWFLGGQQNPVDSTLNGDVGPMSQSLSGPEDFRKSLERRW